MLFYNTKGIKISEKSPVCTQISSIPYASLGSNFDACLPYVMA